MTAAFKRAPVGDGRNKHVDIAVLWKVKWLRHSHGTHVELTRKLAQALGNEKKEDSLASISYLAILVKYILAKKKDGRCNNCHYQY